MSCLILSLGDKLNVHNGAENQSKVLPEVV